MSSIQKLNPRITLASREEIRAISRLVHRVYPPQGDFLALKPDCKFLENDFRTLLHILSVLEALDDFQKNLLPKGMFSAKVSVSDFTFSAHGLTCQALIDFANIFRDSLVESARFSALRQDIDAFLSSMGAENDLQKQTTSREALPRVKVSLAGGFEY